MEKNPLPGSETGRAGFSREKTQKPQKDGAAWERTHPSKQKSIQLDLFICTPFAPYGVPCFCSVVRIGRFGGDGPIRPTLQKATNAAKRARSLDNNIEDRNIRSAERVGARIVRYGRHYRGRKERAARALQFCSVGRIGPSPLHLQGNHQRIGSCFRWKIYCSLSRRFLRDSSGQSTSLVGLTSGGG